jgi:hypothetical protein
VLFLFLSISFFFSCSNRFKVFRYLSCVFLSVGRPTFLLRWFVRGKELRFNDFLLTQRFSPEKKMLKCRDWRGGTFKQIP